MTTPAAPHSSYRPEIDGLRAIAVLAVLGFHADLGLGGGYVGVDVFFVISGFLITGIILKDLREGTFGLAAFLERRVRRIMPALATVVVATLAVGWWLLLPVDFASLGRGVIAQALLVANVHFWLDANYFAPASDLKPLLHTWSLAVEEQFYLLFPLVLIALRHRSRHILLGAVLLLAGLSLALSVYASYTHPSANFYLLPTRAWELMVGALLAVWPARRPITGWVGETLSAGGLIAILAAVVYYQRETRFPGLAALLPCGGAGLLIWANQSRLTFTGRLLATRPLVGIGLISYSLYLWHWPVLVFSRYWQLEPVSAGLRWALVGLCFALAVLSWHFVETPFRKRRVFARRAPLFAAAVLTTAAFVGTGFALVALQGVPSRLPAAVQRYADGVRDVGPQPWVSLADVQAGKLHALGGGEPSQPVRFLLWGDSHAMCLLPVLEEMSRAHGVRGVAATYPQTAPLVGVTSRGTYSQGANSIAYGEAVLDFIRQAKVPHVLLVARWRGYPPEDVRRGLRATLAALENSGTRLWLLKPVPEHPWPPHKALAAAALFGDDPAALGLPLASHLHASQALDPIFAEITPLGLTLLDPTAALVDEQGRCRIAADGHSLYFDEHHLTQRGSRLLRPLLEPMILGSPAGLTASPLHPAR